MSISEFELVQVHENGDNAEIVVRDKNSFKVYAGNLDIVSDPWGYYPPDYFKDRPLKSKWKSVDHMQDIKPYEQLFVSCEEVVDDDGDVSEACVVLGMLTLKRQLVYKVWHGEKMFHGIRGATHYIPSALIVP